LKNNKPQIKAKHKVFLTSPAQFDTFLNFPGMIRHMTLVLCICILQIANAQVTKTDEIIKALHTTNKDTVAWMHGGSLNLGINEGFLHNWSAGGELASFTANGIFTGHLDHLDHNKVWSNVLNLNYGLNYAYSQGFLPHKTDDRIDFTTKYGVKIDSSKNMFFTALGNFKSQFTKGYNYQLTHWDSASTSKFLSPAYITAALGLEYRRGSNLSLFLSPAAARLTMASTYYTTQSPQGAFGIAYGKSSYYEFGAYFSGTYNWQINKKTSFKTRLDLYSNYLAKNTKDSTGVVIKKDNPGNINFLFDNLLVWKVSKLLNITVGATFIYDNNIPYTKPTIANGLTDPGSNLGWLQVKQIMVLGIEYKF
jgi:hypothetical protein